MSTTSTEEGRSPSLGGKTKQLRGAIALICVCAWVILPARPASAHAIVLSTQPSTDEIVPRAPDGVVMRFNEPVEVSFGAIRVFDSDGNRVDEGDAEHLEGRADEVEVPLESRLPAGTYTVTWRVVSADAHPISEAFVFHVEAPGPRPQGIADEILATDSGSGRLPGIIYGVARWVNFAALLILAGGAIFLAAVWRRGSGIQRQAIVEHVFLRRWKTIVFASWVAALLATLASFVLQGAMAGDLPLSEALSSSVLRAVAETRFGKVMLAKLLLLGALAVFLLASRRLLRPGTGESVGAAGSSQRLSATGVVAGGVLIAILLATPGLAGHAGTTDPVALNVSADTLHLAAGAAWLGGLVLLLAAAFPATKTLSDHDSAATMAPVVGRFSDMAVIAVSVIVVTGVYRAWLEVGALRALTGETYGWVLLIKVAAFLPIVVMGAVNNRWAKPRIQRAASENGSARVPLLVLRRVIGAEIALAVVVLAVTALLVNLPPARVAASVSGRPFVMDVHTADHMFNVLVDPNEVGENEVHVTVASHAGAPAPIKELKVLFRMPAEDIGPLVGQGRRLQKGHFVVQGHQLSVPGDWQLEIVARVSHFEETRATVSVPVNE